MIVETQTFYLPNEENGSESIYLDHPVTGVTWVGEIFMPIILDGPYQV